MHTCYADLCRDQTSRNLNKQIERDLNLLEDLKAQGMPDFPMSKLDFDEFKYLIFDATEDYCLYIFIESKTECIVYYQEKLFYYNSRKEAIRDLFKTNELDSITIGINYN